MGFDISLADDRGEPCEVPPHSHGGVYVVGGTDEASMSVTYNYQGFWRALGKPREGIDPGYGLAPWLHGLSGRESIALLERGMALIENDPPASDYWEVTAGNARKVLEILLGWARAHPAGRWEVSNG